VVEQQFKDTAAELIRQDSREQLHDEKDEKGQGRIHF
jgi:hypothetical protein